MRKLWIAIFIILLVVAALSIGLNIGLMLNRQPSERNQPPTPTPIPVTPSTQPTEPTPTPIPTPVVTPSPRSITITDYNITVTYSEVSRMIIGSQTRVILLIDAHYQGEAVTLSYSNFILSVLTSRGGLEPYPIYLQSDQTSPIEAGSVVVGGSGPQVSFQLTYEFSTLQQSSMGGIIPFHSYELRYV